MGVIKRDTAAKIWQCYREIDTAQKMLDDMGKLIKEKDPHAQFLKDAFGRQQPLQLGIPSGENCHRLYDVSPKLALSVIKCHIASKKVELFDANVQARLELEQPLKHVFHVTADDDNPTQILDSNGEVVLSLCRVCGGVESSLSINCPGRKLTSDECELISEGKLDF